MAEELSKDYANYINQLDIVKEITPISNSIDEMMARLEEFESVLNIVQSDKKAFESTLPQSEEFHNKLQSLSKKIDDLQKFVNVVDENVTKLEAHVDVAAAELGYDDSGIKGFLKPIFGNNKAKVDVLSNLDENQKYVPPKIFKTSDYFPSSSGSM